MESVSGHTIVVTGGASGIGLALAIRFLQSGNTVILVGRRLSKLQEAKAAHPGFHIVVGDVGTPHGREALFLLLTTEHPSIDVFVNNAGIQRTVDLKQGVTPDWDTISSEININYAGVVHTTLLWTPFLLKKPFAAFVNVTSGLSFAPLASVPVYSSTKAALHSFTWSLRYQLANTSIKVIEVIPPAVDTDLQAPGLHTFGVNVDEFADAVYARLGAGEVEIGFGMAEAARLAFRQSFGEGFVQLNARFQT
ncbi:hypothetical protein DYB25_005201 [Aphanomyces astaci]|uniref:Oxidoreductase n=1 Tax=Aphanomyces astaci TaxID=112090 RepID=A0A397ELD8_APHAT|nr:hypothetical protein DYB25_005201 [Aphanomyces astaci]RHY61130.1 hypothetical protein DYB30_006144 [Aphanomyces astaci]RHY80725.1 hypothetical protein DYB31_005453 [Aphanomyces astaci]